MLCTQISCYPKILRLTRALQIWVCTDRYLANRVAIFSLSLQYIFLLSLSTIHRNCPSPHNPIVCIRIHLVQWHHYVIDHPFHRARTIYNVLTAFKPPLLTGYSSDVTLNKLLSIQYYHNIWGYLCEKYTMNTRNTAFRFEIVMVRIFGR